MVKQKCLSGEARPHTTDFDSDVDFRTGCGNVNHC